MASLMPQGKQRYTDNNGNNLSGGKLYTYAAGTSTPLATYSDQAGAVPNANPVVLNARGEATIFWGSAPYKAVLTDASDVEIWTQDNLQASTGAADLASTSATKGAALVGYLPGGTVKAALDSADVRLDGIDAALVTADSRLDTLEARTPAAESIVIFSSGQSNMPQDVAYTWTPPSNLYVWNFNANSQASSVVGTAFVAASGTVIGPSIAAGAVLAKENPRANVYVINIHRGGLGLVNWGATPPDYNFRQAIDGNVPAALAAISRTDIDYFVWGGCESDANAQSQTIATDFETNLMVWLKTKSWYQPYTPVFIFGMSPYAQSAPGNLDYLWRRYNGALKACVAVDPSCRAYIDLDDFPLDYFDAGSAIPYIHRTGEGYYKSGEKLGLSIVTGTREPIERSGQAEGVYTADATISNQVNCSGTTVGWATWCRVGNTITVNISGSLTITAATNTTFDVATPVKAKSFPNNVVGNITTANGDAGIVINIANTQGVRATFPSAVPGLVAFCMTFNYRVNHSDLLPNSPPGTT